MAASTAWAPTSPAVLRAKAVATQALVALTGLAWVQASLSGAALARERLNPPSRLQDLAAVPLVGWSLLLWAALLSAGCLWGEWQRSVAGVALTRAPVPRPGWHAQAWWAPGLEWTAPRRNLHSLASALGVPGGARVLDAWWAGWIAFRVSAALVVWQLWIFPAWLLPTRLTSTVCLVAQLGATCLAVIVLQRVTDAAVAALRRPTGGVFEVLAPPPHATGLAVAGGVVRAVEPILLFVVFASLTDAFAPG